MRFHRGEKQHECQYCDFRCQEANNLKRHMALHFESQRNFVCEICGAAFHAKKTLEVHHIYKHNNERKFECQQCFLSFKDKSALKRHEKVHSLEKEHKCVCGMAFRRVCNLRRHLRLVHGGDENYLPPVKHVSTLDNHKKKPVSKTDFVDQVKDRFEGESVYEAAHDTSVDSGMSRPAYVSDDVSKDSGRLYKVSLLRPCVSENADTVEATNPNLSDDSTATMSDYSQQAGEEHTPTETVHKPEDPHETIVHPDISQQISNREMFVGNFCFPHLAMATNSLHEQPTAVLPHIHMLQNPQFKDNLQMPLPKPPPQKFTFTFGNHWQKFIHNELDFGYRDTEHSFRFPSTHLDNSVFVHQRLVNHDPRDALHDAREALQHPREALHDPREALHDPTDTLHDPREALQHQREALHDPREVLQDPREALHDPREALQDPREALHDPRGALQDPRDTLHGDMTMRIQQEELSQKSLHEGAVAVEQNLVGEKLVNETGYASPYPVSYSHQNSYDPATIGSKAAMSEVEQAEENEYFQSRREMAAESLAQMAALAMDASFQQQTNGMKSQLL